MRIGLEWVLRTIIFVLLAWYLIIVLDIGRAGSLEVSSSAVLEESLTRWSTIARPAWIQIELDHPPTRLERDWLAAFPGAGTEVIWTGPDLVPTAIVMEPRADPAGGVDVSVDAPEGAEVVLRDTLGTLEETNSGMYGLRAYVPDPQTTIDAVVGPVIARAAQHDSLELRRLLVVGAANWETKFVTAALEERGWSVDVEIAVSPETTVQQGRAVAIDTASYSAVLALDTTAARLGDEIARYVRTGGGLVLWSPAARVRALAPLAPGRPGSPIDDKGKVPGDDLPRDVLGLVPITTPESDAVVLERRGEDITLAARRLGAGRVIQTGYTNSWRWRMAGGDAAPDEHRTWLAGLVARVAYTGRQPLPAPLTDPAPLATLIDRLGPAAVEDEVGPTRDPRVYLPLIFAALCIGLLAEWLLRRTRGAR